MSRQGYQREIAGPEQGFHGPYRHPRPKAERKKLNLTLTVTGSDAQARPQRPAKAPRSPVGGRTAATEPRGRARGALRPLRGSPRRASCAVPVHFQEDILALRARVTGEARPGGHRGYDGTYRALVGAPGGCGGGRSGHGGGHEACPGRRGAALRSPRGRRDCPRQPAETRQDPPLAANTAVLRLSGNYFLSAVTGRIRKSSCIRLRQRCPGACQGDCCRRAVALTVILQLRALRLTGGSCSPRPLSRGIRPVGEVNFPQVSEVCSCSVAIGACSVRWTGQVSQLAGRLLITGELRGLVASRRYSAERAARAKAAREVPAAEAPSAYSQLRARRRQREQDAPGHATPEQLAARWAYYGGRCWMCGEPATLFEHVKPLFRGGGNWSSNQRPSCWPCNRRKAAQWPYPTNSR